MIRICSFVGQKLKKSRSLLHWIKLDCMEKEILFGHFDRNQDWNWGVLELMINEMRYNSSTF